MEKKDILKAVIERFADGSNARMAKKLGVTPATISAWLSRNTFDLEKIFKACPGVSALFLITGEGDITDNESIGVKDMREKLQYQDEIIALQKRQIELLEEKLRNSSIQ